MATYTPAYGANVHNGLLTEMLQRNRDNVTSLQRLHKGASGPAKDIVFDLMSSAHQDQAALYRMLEIIKETK